MAASSDIICPVCGATNPESAKRCGSCGARLETLERQLTAEEEAARRYQQTGFEWKWVFISLGVYIVLQGIFLVGLDMLVAALDFQGLPGLMISAALWFVGGIIVGFLSPGKTFLEPAIGALLAVLPTVAWLMYIDVVAQISMPAYIIGGFLGVMITLFGAFIGERVQMMTEK
ncbi:MAG: zinc ribbon domain-containing protein [Myxococcota bacterium]